MADTFIKIASVTVGSGGSSTVTFSSIPSTYTDLLVKISARNTAGGAGLQVTFNGSSGTTLYLEGNGASASSGTDAQMYGGDTVPSSFTANVFASNELYIPNYNSSNYKSSSSDAVTENNSSTSYIDLYANIWSNTSAITSMTFFPNANSFAQYSTFTLYGIKNS